MKEDLDLEAAIESAERLGKEVRESERRLQAIMGDTIQAGMPNDEGRKQRVREALLKTDELRRRRQEAIDEVRRLSLFETPLRVTNRLRRRQ